MLVFLRALFIITLYHNLSYVMTLYEISDSVTAFIFYDTDICLSFLFFNLAPVKEIICDTKDSFLSQIIMKMKRDFFKE